ncbi:Chloride channel protein ClC-Kb [Liparis tanakae]|uniref:Chloride channel protein ClC-Kb n=1 Tax=Liparis tanakae TaxID=230148 RepID=A0A4Z2GYL5_9TELE|nr:Chloride channel protein ClC-Kb [Liparis tanakae]
MKRPEEEEEDEEDQEAAGSGAVGEDDDRQRGNQSDASYNETLLLADPWKPCRRSRAAVKGWLLKLRGCLEAGCGMEWYGYAALGVSMAVLSFLMDLSVAKLLRGSGIPEVRTMLAGIEMPQYLSLTNMFSKFLGLICTLAAGSTIFLGKVGPFVHLSTMVGAYLSNMCTLMQADKKEKAAGEMHVVAAAVGVASCFGAPISVMSSHFALEHYCPCFFSAACGALTFRLLPVWSGDGETPQALFKTNFPPALPFYPLEILLFAFLGLLCGAASLCFLLFHRRTLLFTKTNGVILKMLTTE